MVKSISSTYHYLLFKNKGRFLQPVDETPISQTKLKIALKY